MLGRFLAVCAGVIGLWPSVLLAQPTFDEVAYANVPVTGGTFNVTMDIYQATSGTGPRPAVLWIHGGGWSGGSHNSVPASALALRSRGITVVSVEYRLSGQAIFPAQIQDVKGAVRFLRANAATYNIDPNRIGAWGSSAGGHLTALLATSGGVSELEGATGGNLAFSSTIQAGADYFGPTDIININLDVTTPPGSGINHDAPDSPESRLIGFSGTGQGIGVLRANLSNPTAPFPEKAHLASLVNPITHVTSNDPPMYIGHGDSDTSVPNFQSTRLKNALDSAGVPATLRIVPGAGHGALGSTTDAEAADFLVATLTGTSTCTPPSIIEPPRGIYCSCGPTTATGGHSIVPEIAAKDFVEGTLVRVAWRDLQPTATTFNWTLLDNELARARTNNTKVVLAIVNGPSAPTWLASQGVQMFNFTTPQGAAASMPVPWDSTYLAAWTNFVMLLGARYNAESTIVLVHATHSTANGFEMQIPFWANFTNQWNSIGYTTQRNLDSWIEVLDAFALAFPSKPLDVEVHPVLNSDAVAQGVWTYVHSNYGPRFGLLAAWWSQNNANGIYSGMHTLLQQAGDQSFGMTQLVTNATSNPNGFGPGGIAGAFDLAYNDGLRYVEVWNQDLLNTGLESLLRSTSERFREPVRMCAGASASFSIFATGSGPLAYQWTRDGTPITNGERVQGATSATLSILNAAGIDAGSYSCTVSNACATATSSPSLLVVCVADTDDGNATGTCDGGVTVDDLLYYLGRFESGAAQADVDDGSGLGSPDGGVTIDDLLYYLGRFEAGC